MEGGREGKDKGGEGGGRDIASAIKSVNVFGWGRKAMWKDFELKVFPSMYLSTVQYPLFSFL